MLPSKNRLPGHCFPALLKSKNSYNCPFFTIKFKKRLTQKSVFRAAIIVSTKISKKAVIRNRFKRFFRQSLNLCLSRLNPSYDLLILVKPNIINSSFSQIKTALQTVLIHTKILKNEKNNP